MNYNVKVLLDCLLSDLRAVCSVRPSDILVHTKYAHEICQSSHSIVECLLAYLHRSSAADLQNRHCWPLQLALDRIPFRECLGPVHSDVVTFAACTMVEFI